MFHKVKSVTPLDNFILSVLFMDGVEKKYDVKALFQELPIFQTFLYTRDLFCQVQVDAGGHGISWNDEIDLSAEELYIKGF